MEQRPFTVTGPNAGDARDFVIKVYSDHDGGTDRTGALETRDALLIDMAFPKRHIAELRRRTRVRGPPAMDEPEGRPDRHRRL